jgi:uncharacterized protein YpbB
MYSDIAYETLKLLQTYYYFWGCFSDRVDVFRKFFTVKRDSDMQVYIEISKEQRYKVGSSLNNRFFNMLNPFLKKSNTEVLKFLAKKLKVATQYDAKRRASRNNLDIDEWTKWSADNKNCVFSPDEYSTFNLSLTCHITMSDVYLICKKLTGIKNKSHDRIVGKALTIEEINEIANSKHVAEMKDKLIDEYRIQQYKLFETYRQKLKDEYDNLRKEFTDRLHAIDATCNANDMLGLSCGII